MSLPIEPHLPDIISTLGTHRNLILQADPGAGKTTLVPLALLNSTLTPGGRIIMLEPRRIATRAAAERMAKLLGEKVGEQVGYRMRGETKASANTRIEVVTEALLTRLLLDDPELPGVSFVLFDEFHERSIHSDIGLALALETQRILRPDLKLVVMSATLEGGRLLPLLGDARHIQVAAPSFPIETRFVPPITGKRFEEHVVSVVVKALRSDEGDILAFLPGRREIVRVEELLSPHLSADTVILPLYGESGWNLQAQALTQDPKGRRKVILATNIAETSLTIDGIRIVVDGGLARVPRFDEKRGMNHLDTVTVSRASADQRRGRAGRQAPGICYRLWGENEPLIPYAAPEITNCDLTPVVLTVAAWGNEDPSALPLLDPPPQKGIFQAQQVLRSLGAVDSHNRITAHGRELIRLGIHPRLGHMLITANQIGAGALAATVAAFLENGGRGLRDAGGGDLESKFERLSRSSDRMIFEQRDRLLSLLGISPATEKESASIGLLTALAYPERIAKRRFDSPRRFLLANGRGGELPPQSSLAGQEFLAVAEIDGTQAHARIHLAAKLSEEEIRKYFGEQFVVAREASWESGSRLVVREVERLGAIEMSSKMLKPSPKDASAAMISRIQKDGLSLLPWTAEVLELRTRSEWLRRNDHAPANWPNLSDNALHQEIEEWLSPFLPGVTAINEIPLGAAILSRFSHEQRKFLDLMAPGQLTLPSGTTVSIDYSSGGGPQVSIFLQEALGQSETPRIANGNVPITFELLSPAKRPLQITKDLKSFWNGAYKDVRKEMMGRYPRHYWPEDPSLATPQRRTTKPRPR